MVPIEVDTARAPAFIRYRFYGEYPSMEEQAAVREGLIAFGLLTADTAALMDVRELTRIPNDDILAKTVAAASNVTRCKAVLAKTVAAALERGGLPRRRAYLIDPASHRHMIEQFQDLAMTTVTTAAFADEGEAMAWLLPGGSRDDRRAPTR